MNELVWIFWITIAIMLITLAFGTLHYRIDRNTDKFYSTLLIIEVLIVLGSGIGWCFTRG